MIYYLTALLNGFFNSINRMTNVRAGKLFGTANGALINYVEATVLSLLLVFVLKNGKELTWGYITAVPWWVYLGSICGLLAQLLQIIGTLHSNTLVSSVLMLVGNLGMSLTLDYVFYGTFSLLRAAGILLILLGIPKWKRGQMELTMLDVGQGDCFFFRDGNGKNYLIDGGSSSVDAAGRYRLEPFLKFRGVKRLDYVWVTHGDVDHLNAVEELLERRKYGVEIQYLIFPEQKYWDERLIKLCNLAEEAGTKVRVMEMDTIFLSGKLKMRCLWPGEGEPSENGNENSLVLHLQYGKITMLFTGDLENTGEELLTERIKNLRKKGELPACYDLLKVGHHGSRNATGEELLEVIRPRVAFCSSGKENRYGHPHVETLERLAKWGVSLYNTKDRGAVSMYTDGREYGIQSP